MKRLIPYAIGLLTLAAVPSSSLAAEKPTPGAAKLLEEIRAPYDGIALWWVGNAGWLIKSGDILIGIDLDLGNSGKIQPPPIDAATLAGELDIALVTHHHGDHCHSATLKTLAERGESRFVLPSKCLEQLEDASIQKDRLLVPKPGTPFEMLGIKIRPIHAIHGNQNFTVLTREPDFIDSIANSCGYILELGGKTLFHPGDSVLTEEHLALTGIDVLFISPTVHNMYIDRSKILIETLRPDFIFPQHFGTYRQTEENSFWTRGYPDELRARLPEELRDRYFKLQQGERFVIE